MDDSLKQTASPLDLNALRTAIQEHALWLKPVGSRRGKRADLSFFNLSNQSLPGIALGGAKLAGTNLRRPPRTIESQSGSQRLRIPFDPGFVYFVVDER